MQKARRHPTLIPKDKCMRLRPLVGAWFQVLLTPLTGVLFTFQSPYWSTIGHQVVLSLGGWSPQLHAGFHEPDATLDRSRDSSDFCIRGCHPLWLAFPDHSACPNCPIYDRPQPRTRRFGLGLSAFARRYSRSLG